VAGICPFRRNDAIFVLCGKSEVISFLFIFLLQAVQDYIRAQRVLQQYGNMASFQGIQSDCEAIVEELKQKLRDQFKSKEVTFRCCALTVLT
jgi:hypothetical protein